MAVDDAIVKGIISTALNNNGWKADQCCGTIGKAFRELQAHRQQPGNSLDLNYAAAEHYMFARWMVCTGRVSKTQMKILDLLVYGRDRG